MNIETELHGVISTGLEKLGEIDDITSEKYKNAADSLAKLMDKAIDMEKIHVECDDKEETRVHEYELKLAQMKDDRKHRWISHVMNGLGIGLPILVTIWGTKMSLKFEETGTVTTIMGRGFINKLLPKK